MKDQPIPKKFRALVKDAIKRHAWNIGVSNYVGDILYMKEDKKSENDAGIYAEIDVDRRYLGFVLKIYPLTIKRWKEKGDSFLEEVIAHEVGHLATSHLYWLATCVYKDDGETKDAWETLTTIIGRLSEKIDELERRKKK